MERWEKTEGFLIAAMVIGLIVSWILPRVPGAVFEPIWSLYGLGGMPFRGNMHNYITDRSEWPPIVTFFGFIPLATIGTLSLWYASRLDVAESYDDRPAKVVGLVALYLVVALTLAFVGDFADRASIRDLWIGLVFIVVFIGYPILLTLPAVTIGVLVVGIFRAPDAVRYLSARYQAEKTYPGSVGKAQSSGELWARVLTRTGPPEAVVEDTERFQIEERISELMLEAEKLRTEIAILTEAKRGTRR